MGVTATNTSAPPVVAAGCIGCWRRALGRWAPSVALAMPVPAMTRAPMATTMPNFVPGSARIWRTPAVRRG